MLPAPAENDPNRQEIKVYLLGSEKSMLITISKHHRVEDIIKHILVSYTMNASLSAGTPLEYPYDSGAYELRLLDDDDDGGFAPLYEIAALDRKKKIGEFDVDCIAFCQIRDYKAKEPTKGKSEGKSQIFKFDRRRSEKQTT